METKPSSMPKQKSKKAFCLLCRNSYLKQESYEHMHSMLHHRELETVLGKHSHHECHICKASSMGLNQYAEHISTAHHKAKMTSLLSKNVKPISLEKIINQETLSRILERNKILKKKERTATKKKKKKLKQLAVSKHGQMPPEAARKTNMLSRAVNPKKSKQASSKKRMLRTHQKGINGAIVQSKENEWYSLQRGGPTGRTGHLPSYHNHLRFDDNFSVNNQYIGVERDNFRPDRHAQRPGYTQSCGSNHWSEELPWPGVSCYNCYHQADGATDFTSDQLPQIGSIIFGPDEGVRSFHPGPEQGPPSANSASVHTSSNAAPIQDLNVEAMLWQIRRALGVREPCRADREARKTSSERGLKEADPRATQQAGAEKEQPAGGCFWKRNTATAATSVQPPQATTAPADPKQMRRMTQRTTWEESSVGPSNSREVGQSRQAFALSTCKSVTSGGGCQGRSNRNSTGQTAHNSDKGQREKEVGLHTALQPTKVLSSSGAESKCNWREMYNKMKRDQRDKGTHMFRIELVNPPSDQEASIQEHDYELPLSEGFHWESVPPATPRPHRCPSSFPLPPPPPPPPLSLPQDTADKDSNTETSSERGLNETDPRATRHAGAEKEQPGGGCFWKRNTTAAATSVQPPQAPPPPPLSPPQDTADNDSNTETQMHRTVAQPTPTLENHSGQRGAAAAEAVFVKMEPDTEVEIIDLTGNSRANKRKHQPDDYNSDNKASGKKKKTTLNKDQNQMDQLLSVSLREEELSQSLQDLDSSLILARNALQAAYTEVQRLLLLKQQCTAEVNSLRAKRIEILKGMQEGYSGASNVVAKAATSSAGAADTAQPRSSSLSPSSVFVTSLQQPTATNPTISQPRSTSLAMPTVSVSQESCQSHTDGQPRQLAKMASRNTDSPLVSLNQHAPLFPPDLLPTLLVPPPLLAASTAAFTKQLEPECTVVNTSPPAESSHRQQEHVATAGLKDTAKTRTLVREEARLVLSDSEDETGGNVSKEQVKDNSTSTAAPHDAGNESNAPVEITPSSLVVINITESDNEDSPEIVSNAPVQQEFHQNSVGRAISSACNRTCQPNHENRKTDPLVVSVPETSIPPESVEVVEDELPALGAFENHTGPVHSLQVHEGLLYTCSGDNTARAYSLANKQCQAVFEGHTNKVNCLLVSSLPNMPTRLYTGSSDETIRCYSIKSNKYLEKICLPDRVLCLHIAWNVLFAGLANGSVASYDLKTLKQLDVFECHGPRGVSCLGTTQEGARRLLLVGSYDSTISVRDAKSGLLLRSLEGHTKTVLCMKVVNDLVFSGSSDTSVHAYNIHTGELMRVYKGHGHAVTSIAILGKVMVTACLDKLVRVYELQSNDCFQVYGGHSDLVMCMAIHKSVIYTGCYDGSVQAVELNPMKNFRCWWQNCSLVFGVAEHLVRHLVGDHSNPNLQTAKCRWRGCSTCFTTQQAVRQELPDHMQSHVALDSNTQP